MNSLDKLKEIFSDILDIPEDQINDEVSPLNNPQWDSVRNLMLLAGIENAFNISLEYEDMMNMTDFGKVKNGLKNYGLIF